MRFEADVALVMRCVAKGWCPPAMAERQAQGDGTEKMGAQNAPARNVTWAEADRACSFIGARLPTEAEWELAARGTDGRRWPWGNLPACGVSWPHGSPILNKEQVGDPELEALMRPPCELPVPRSVGLGVGRSPYLLLAMAGNVAEWTSDLYAPYTAQGRGAPAEGERRRVTRGGGWLDADPRDLRATVRVPVDAETWMPDVGFRCVWGRKDGG
jgi:formylglycine-generating enzyme required for sulfatase activity